MIKHTVLFKIKADVSQQDIEAIFSELMELKNKLPGINAIAGGRCYFIEDSEDKFPMSHGFTIDFVDEKSRDNFLTNPLCDDVKNHIIDSIEGGYDSLFGFEFNTGKST